MKKTRPAYRIVANGVDIADKLAHRLKSLEVIDAAGFESDTCEIVLADDMGHPIDIPPAGAELQVFMGYDTGMRNMGLFVVDEVEPGGWPAYLAIRGRATPYEGSKLGKTDMQTQKTRTWPQGTKLGDVVAKIAKEHDLVASVAPELRALALPQFDQTDESDVSFLVRVTRKYDALVKSAGGSLVVVKRGESKAGSGRDLPAVTVQPKGLTRWDMTFSTREDGGTVVAYWHDHRAGKRQQVAVGSGDPVRRLRHPYPDEESARRAAQGELDKRTRTRNRLVLTMPGDSSLTAESPLTLEGFRVGIPTSWVVSRVVHRMHTDAGYSCQVEAEAPTGA